MSSTAFKSACAAGIHYLTRHQDSLGRWRDYDLPVGQSDAWTTALVGFVCADCSARLAGAEGGEAQHASRCASAWLREQRDYSAGWGYNAATGPDADSTAWAMRLLTLLGDEVPEPDVEFLISHWVDESGFATYQRSDAWGLAHPDVTPVVALALPVSMQRAWRDRILNAVLKGRGAHRTWPSYWWRSAHYATAATAELIAAWQLDIRCDLYVDSSETHALHSDFDTACALMSSSLAGLPVDVSRPMAEHLLDSQTADGGWIGTDSLRVTEPDCPLPWLVPRGRRYVDERGLVTTAFVIRALCHWMEYARCDDLS